MEEIIGLEWIALTAELVVRKLVAAGAKRCPDQPVVSRVRRIKTKAASTSLGRCLMQMAVLDPALASAKPGQIVDDSPAKEEETEQKKRGESSFAMPTSTRIARPPLKIGRRGLHCI